MTDPVSAAGPRPVPPQVEATARKTAQEFEAVFVGAMTKLMMESVETGEEFSGGHGEQMFRGIMAEQLGGEIVKQGGFGIAPAVMDQILRMQGYSK